ncbi:MAG: alpha/beta hydrolase [Candidatus Dormibacteraeota bacterium]|nr:alpha/beta hydrolase [Candidatus Dormibacteraeota bacterium]
MATITSRLSPTRLGRGVLLSSAAVLILGAATIHLAGLSSRLAESSVLGVGTAALGLAQIGLAAALLVAPTRRLLLVGVVASLGAALLWGIGHTVGAPVGLTIWQPEPLSIPDLFLPLLEVVAALLLVLATRRAPRPVAPRAWLTCLALVPIVLLTAIFVGAGALGAPDDTWLSAHSTVSPVAGRTTTLTYCSPGGKPLAMDVTEPASAASRPAPAVLYVHGGGWFMGDRQPSGGFAGQEGALFIPLRDELTKRGFVVAAIDYRLVPLHPWPAQIEDAKCAVRFMRAQAARLNIDPNRIGTWGSSAGGHLVAMLGTAGPEAGFDVGQYADQSSRVQAVVDMFGPTDLNNTSGFNTFGQFVVRVGFGRASAAERSAASPITHVGPGDPPFLILHGSDDMLVPPRQSQDLAHRLGAAGVPVALVMVQHTGHSMASPGQQPSTDDVTAMVVDFFSRTLGLAARRGSWPS